MTLKKKQVNKKTTNTDKTKRKIEKKEKKN